MKHRGNLTSKSYISLNKWNIKVSTVIKAVRQIAKVWGQSLHESNLEIYVQFVINQFHDLNLFLSELKITVCNIIN